MPLKVFILDTETGKFAKVSANNELMVAQQFSTASKVTLTVDDTAVNLVKPQAGKKIIVTGLIVNTNRDIGVNGALIEIYEASSETSGTVFPRFTITMIYLNLLFFKFCTHASSKGCNFFTLA